MGLASPPPDSQRLQHAFLPTITAMLSLPQIVLETGEIGRQASGAVMATDGETVRWALVACRGLIPADGQGHSCSVASQLNAAALAAKFGADQACLIRPKAAGALQRLASWLSSPLFLHAAQPVWSLQCVSPPALHTPSTTWPHPPIPRPTDPVHHRLRGRGQQRRRQLCAAAGALHRALLGGGAHLGRLPQARGQAKGRGLG